MELRKDPITRSWVVVGDREGSPQGAAGCPLCLPAVESQPTLFRLPPDGPWQVLVQPNPGGLYRVEGDPDRRADGMYDVMRAAGADEIIIETPGNDRNLGDLT